MPRSQYNNSDQQMVKSRGQSPSNGQNRRELLGSGSDSMTSRPSSSSNRQYNGQVAGSGRNDHSQYDSSRGRMQFDDDEEEYATRQILDEGKSIRQESVQTTRDALNRLYETQDVASNTMQTLNTQSQLLHKSKRDLDLAKINQDVAEEQVSELKRLNRFFPSLKNPFASKSKQKKVREDKVKREYQAKVGDEIETRKMERATEMRLHKGLKQQQQQQSQSSGSPQKVSDKYKSQRDAKQYSALLDDEDVAQEKEIEENVDKMMDVLGRLKGMGMAMGQETVSQNEVIETIGQRADDLNVRIGVQNSRLKKI
ncbi:hypothetical protein MP228_006140 [Amoeboaphelidium protococcarum]|nr:hypothetical protein MP228_006140 [Amoeboaphelidium protococcarum]